MPLFSLPLAGPNSQGEPPGESTAARNIFQDISWCTTEFRAWQRTHGHILGLCWVRLEQDVVMFDKEQINWGCTILLLWLPLSCSACLCNYWGFSSHFQIQDWGTSPSVHSGKAALVFCSPRALLAQLCSWMSSSSSSAVVTCFPTLLGCTLNYGPLHPHPPKSNSEQHFQLQFPFQDAKIAPHTRHGSWSLCGTKREGINKL